MDIVRLRAMNLFRSASTAGISGPDVFMVLVNVIVKNHGW